MLDGDETGMRGEETGKSVRLDGEGGTNGRKLQLEFGLLATRVNISEMRRCCTDVSCR